METDEVLSRLIFFIAIPGLISNAIAFLILNRKDMASSNNYLLKGMFKTLNTYIIWHFNEFIILG